MEKILFSKYSNDRDARFAIRTDIVSNAGRKKVKKLAMFKEGAEHLRNQSSYYEKYNKLYKNAGLNLLQSKYKKEVLYYQYKEGSTVSEQIDELIGGHRYAEAVDIICDFCQRIRKLYSNENWNRSDEFVSIFGDADCEGMKAASFIDFDLVPENVINCDGTLYVMDYEWIFDFPVPADYVAYRAIRTLLYSGGGRKKLEIYNLYDRIGLTGQQLEIFDRMECCFQNYVLGERITAAMLYSYIGKPVYTCSEIEENRHKKEYAKQAVIYYDLGEGFSEDNKVTYSSENGKYELCIPKGTRAVRFDPCSCPCTVSALRINGKVPDINSSAIDFNGAGRGDEIWFATDDPQIILTDIDAYNDDGHLLIEADVRPDNRRIITLWEKPAAENVECNIDVFDISENGTVNISGWCFSKDRNIFKAVICMKGRECGVEYGIERGDVYSVYSEYASAERCGFSYSGRFCADTQGAIMKFCDEEGFEIATVVYKLGHADREEC